MQSIFCLFDVLFISLLSYLLGLFLRVHNIHELFLVLPGDHSIILTVIFKDRQSPLSGLFQFFPKLVRDDSLVVCRDTVIGKFDLSLVINGHAPSFWAGFLFRIGLGLDPIIHFHGSSDIGLEFLNNGFFFLGFFDLRKDNRFLLFLILSIGVSIQQIQQKLLGISSTIPIVIFGFDLRNIGGKFEWTCIWTKLVLVFEGSGHGAELPVGVLLPLGDWVLRVDDGRLWFWLRCGLDCIGVLGCWGIVWDFGGG